MPHSYTDEELQNGRWVTVHGHRIFIKEGDTEKDIKEKFERSINKNPQADEKTQAAHQKAIKELSSDAYEDGTYDVDTKKTVEFDKGFQVTFCQIGDNYSPAEYAKKVNECLALSSNGKTYAGKFEGTPEISFHCNNKEQAIAYAKANNQISIWDWENCNEIKTGGTGRRK